MIRQSAWVAGWVLGLSLLSQAIAQNPQVGSAVPNPGIDKALATLDSFRVFEDADGWVGAVRDVTGAGREAVPALTAKLAGSRRGPTLAATAMALRIINDRRTVPALIYALRRTQPKASDFGIIVPDPELHWLLWEHQTYSRAAPQRVGRDEALSFGRSVREITAALERLTAHSEGSAHFSFYDSLGQYPKDDDIGMYERTRLMAVAVADRWQVWWDANKANLLTAEELAWVNANAPVEKFGPPPAGPRSVRLEVRDGARDRALPGLDLDIWIDFDRYRLRTDAQGVAVVPVPQTIQWLTISARQDGLVPVMACFGPEDALPERFQMVLPAGAPIGGLVRDGQAVPIGNATAYVTIGQKLADHLWASVLDQPATTDAQGRWSMQDAPADLQGCIVRVVHPDYQSEHWYGSSPRKAASVVELREQRFDSVCPALTKIEGIALDAATGRPLTGATISAIDDQFWLRSYPDVQTDAQGRFVLAGVDPRKLSLLLSKPGYAPISRILNPPHPTSLELRARPSGGALSGIVLDPTGKPVASAIVAVGPWEGHRLLSWHTLTNAEGRFSWPDPPAGPVQLRVHRTGFEIGVANVQTGGEATITLAASLTIQGTVTDARTGRPIEKFTIFPGLPWGPNEQPLFQRERGMPGSGGAYSISFTSRQVGGTREGARRRLVRIDAAGYLPFYSAEYTEGQGNQTLNVQLEPAPDITGVVVGPDAKPLRDATVLLATGSQWATIYNGRSDRNVRGENVAATTDEQGRFALPPQREDYVLVALHESGYAEISAADFKQAGTIRVEPWGRVEITVVRNGRPRAGTEVVLGQLRLGAAVARVMHTLSGSSDANGLLVWDRVPAGQYQASIMARSQLVGGLNPDAEVEVKAGETLKLTLPDAAPPGE